MTMPLEDQIRAMEGEAERSDPGTAAHILNRAGDLCLADGDKERALNYYGRAIDANLYGRRLDAAAGMCRKLLRIAPGAVRTRCTLAWLSLGQGDLEETVRELGDYVSAAIRARESDRAADHLARMARITPDERTRELIAAHLERLGRVDIAEQVRTTRAVPASSRTVDGEPNDALWTEIVNAALHGDRDEA